MDDIINESSHPSCTQNAHTNLQVLYSNAQRRGGAQQRQTVYIVSVEGEAAQEGLQAQEVPADCSGINGALSQF